MSKTFKKLNEIFDNEFDSVETSPDITDIVVSKEEKIDLDSDYDYTRIQLYELIKKGQNAIDGIIDIAQNSDHPRAYEVAGQLIKNVADITDKLLDLQKKMKDIKQEPRTGPTTVNNSVIFQGSTAELQKLIKQGFSNNE